MKIPDELESVLRNGDTEFFKGLNKAIDLGVKIPTKLRYIYQWHNGSSAKLWGQYTFHSFESSEAERLEFRKQFWSSGLLSKIIILLYCPFILWSNKVFDFNGDGYYVSRISGKFIYHFNQEWPEKFKSRERFWEFIIAVTKMLNNDFSTNVFVETEIKIRNNMLHSV